MANITRVDEARMKEVRTQYAQMANTLAKIVTNLEELREEESEIRDAIRRNEEKRLRRLKEIKLSKKALSEQQSEAIGAYKLADNLLKKWKVEAPTTKLTRLAASNETVGELINN